MYFLRYSAVGGSMLVSDLPLQQHVDSRRDRQKAICYRYISADDFMNQIDDWLHPLAMLNHICVKQTNIRMQKPYLRSKET